MPPQALFHPPTLHLLPISIPNRLLVTNRKNVHQRGRKKKDQMTEVDGMKVQLRVVMEDSTQWERRLF
jgi:hypothetical protein